MRYPKSLMLAMASLLFCVLPALADTDKAEFSFRGVDYQHRWSKGGQNEFTPLGQADLGAWQDMLTLNVHEGVSSGEQLADVANRVLAAYQQAGKVLRVDSTPLTPERPAEHLVVAMLGSPDFLESVFARFFLNEGTGMVAVYSHRVYGDAAVQGMNDWLQSDGAQVEAALMAMDTLPTAQRLRVLPQSQ